MPAKTPVKKATENAQQTKGLKSVKKTVKKTPKKVTFDDLLKSQDEAWKAIRETQQAVKETQKNIGGLGNSLGSIVERLLIPGLPKKFKKFGYSFNRVASYSYTAGVYAQIDGMLENGEQAIAVEVKTTLRQSDIDDHLVRMEKIQKYAGENGDKRRFMGAMAAFNTDENTKNYALNKGLFVIEPRGDDVKVTKPEGEVRVW